jgi:hypothetical protein
VSVDCRTPADYSGGSVTWPVLDLAGELHAPAQPMRR